MMEEIDSPEESVYNLRPIAPIILTLSEPSTLRRGMLSALTEERALGHVSRVRPGHEAAHDRGHNVGIYWEIAVYQFPVKQL